MAMHSEQWESYPVEFEDGPAAVIVDMGWYEEMPQPGRTESVCLVLPLKEPGEDGLGTDDEVGRVNDMDDALVAEVVRLADAVMVGRVRGGGRIEWFFYAPKGADLDGAVRAVRAKAAGYAPEIYSQADPDWEVYREALYPDESTQRWIGDRSVVMKLEEEGDPLTEAREVDHYAYFGEPHQAEAFAQWATEQGFGAESHEPTDETQGQTVVHLTHESGVDLPTINEVTEMLRRQAELAGGVYDGWETVVVRTEADGDDAAEEDDEGEEEDRD
ncbi:MAG: DUF695 domain-containing protein [Phycisphaeraceae bacterium]|nr:DUF695 domain-containing protein [Phycisphaeraceae bacterium]